MNRVLVLCLAMAGALIIGRLIVGWLSDGIRSEVLISAKARRAQAIFDAIEAGVVYLPPVESTLLDELDRFPKKRHHDDVVDAVMFSYERIAEMMRRDARGEW